MLQPFYCTINVVYDDCCLSKPPSKKIYVTYTNDKTYVRLATLFCLSLCLEARKIEFLYFNSLEFSYFKITKDKLKGS